MRKHAKGIRPDTSMRTRRRRVVSVIGVAIVFAIAATAISMQASKGENPSDEKSWAAGNSRINRLPMRSAQDGQPLMQAQIRPLTQEEAQQMAEGLKKLVNQSMEGLQQVRHADGSVSMDLQGRFQSVALAKRTADGGVTQSCVDNPEAAAAFLGIDRELIGAIKSSPKTRQSDQVETDTGRGGRN